jgi:peptidoglycan/xylan/chitin deacetylase (PgdA/CDA1 family)
MSSTAARKWTRRTACLLALLWLGVAAQGCKGRPRAPILTWHSVAASGDAFTVAPAAFAAQLDQLLRCCTTISLHELLGGGALPQRPVVLTFDDGVADAFTTVLPELQRRGQRATFFIVTGWVGDDEAHRHVENGVRYLIWPEVLALQRAGMEIGSHSVDHARLPNLSRERVRAELVESKAALERRLGAPIDLFAYPYNSLRGWVRDEVAAAGYRAAVAGEVHGGANPLQLHRYSVQARTTAEEVRTMAQQR